MKPFRLLLAAAAILVSGPAFAWCEQWDNRYEYDCWGKWISDAPDLFSELNGDPFTISGGNHSHGGWHFTLDGTRTPAANIPVSGEATYRGDLFGRATSYGNNTDRSGMLYPVIGDVNATADFASGDIDVAFRNIEVYQITTGQSPIDLPDISFNGVDYGNNGGFGADLVCTVGDCLGFDRGRLYVENLTREYYNGRLRWMYRDASMTGAFYGPEAEGVAGKFYFVEGEWKKRKNIVVTDTDGFTSACAVDSCNGFSNIYWKVEGTWGAVD